MIKINEKKKTQGCPQNGVQSSPISNRKSQLFSYRIYQQVFSFLSWFFFLLDFI